MSRKLISSNNLSWESFQVDLSSQYISSANQESQQHEFSISYMNDQTERSVICLPNRIEIKSDEKHSYITGFQMINMTCQFSERRNLFCVLKLKVENILTENKGSLGTGGKIKRRSNRITMLINSSCGQQRNQMSKCKAHIKNGRGKHAGMP